ncbi:MAG: PIG-L family deacetylase, partial [Clostridia bacterium]|nr:PIG-L family deacetylase [Clostridia bacterium]
MKKILFLLGMTAMMVFFAWNGLAEEAADLTEKCAIDVSVYRRNMEYMLDEETTTKWETGSYGGYVEVKTPAGKKSQGVYVQWGAKPIDIWVQVPSKDGKTWINDQKIDGTYYNQYIPFDRPLSQFRLCIMNGEDKMAFIRLQVMGEGELPVWVQQWQPFEGKADLMVLVAHPDDELLFMGGVIPHYNTVEGKKVIVVYIASMPAHRKVELLNGLWHCGVRMYPEMPTPKFRDKNTMDRKECLNLWEEKVLLEHVTGLIRKYRPDVIATHD